MTYVTVEPAAVQRTVDHRTVCPVMCIDHTGTAMAKCKTAVKALIKTVQTMETSKLPRQPANRELVNSQFTGFIKNSKQAHFAAGYKTEAATEGVLLVSQ